MQINWEVIHENFLKLTDDIIHNANLNELFCYLFVSEIQIYGFNCLDEQLSSDNKEDLNGKICFYDNTPCDIINEQDYITRANFAKKVYDNYIIINNIIKTKISTLSDEEKKNEEQNFYRIIDDYREKYSTH